MERSEFLNLLDELLNLEEGTMKDFSPLDSIEEWDSLAIIALMAIADERLGVHLQARCVAECKTVTELMDLLGIT